MIISWLPTSFHVAPESRRPRLSHSSWARGRGSAAARTRPRGRARRSWSPQGWSSRYWRSSSRNSSALRAERHAPVEVVARLGLAVTRHERHVLVEGAVAGAGGARANGTPRPAGSPRRAGRPRSCPPPRGRPRCATNGCAACIARRSGSDLYRRYLARYSAQRLDLAVAVGAQRVLARPLVEVALVDVVAEADHEVGVLARRSRCGRRSSRPGSPGRRRRRSAPARASRPGGAVRKRPTGLDRVARLEAVVVLAARA